METKNIFFLRHGQVAEEFRKVFYGQLDVPLSEEGEQASREVIKAFISIPIKAIFSSPLKRALYPAELLSKEKEAPLIISEELKEIHYGEWTGKPRELIYREPLYWERLKRDHLAPPKGESIKDLRERAKNFWNKLLAEKEGNFVIFTHGGFLRALFCELWQLKSEYFFTFEIFHLKINFISLYKDGLFVIKGLNLHPSHLSPLLIESYW